MAMALALLPASAGAADIAATVFTEADHLLGGYGPYRSNNDLLYYHLDVRVDPEQKYLSGKNTIRFKMLKDGTRIQLDLVPVMQIDKVLWLQRAAASSPLHVERAAGRTVYLDFPRTLKRGQIIDIEFYYSGHPQEMGRFGGIVFRKDPMGRPLVNTACEEEGASVWWPNKDQWRDEVQSMDLSIEAPGDLTEVSNGRFQGKESLPDGYTRWNWHVSYPINNYDVSINIGTYIHFDDRYGDLTLDYYVFPEDLDKAKRQFVQTRDMLNAFTHYFGEYPFRRDGYKLIEALYSGVENQTAITYGNGFANGYLGRPKEGIGTWFDFIIVHESAHEWFGNSITAQDRSDMWIHEGWANYSEDLFVEYMWGKKSAITYLNTGKDKVKNIEPVLCQQGVYCTPTPDQYKKGALFLNTLRSVIDDDAKWFKLLHDYYQHFKYQTIMTTDMMAYFNRHTGQDLSVLFDEYLKHAAIPTLELKFDPPAGEVWYRWRAQEARFDMPVRVGREGHWQLVWPKSEWRSMKSSLAENEFEVATDLYYIKVSKQ